MSAEPKVLITGAGGPSAIGVMKSLSGHAEVFAADIDPHAAGLYLVAAEHRTLLPRGDDPAFVPELEAVCRRERIDAVVPTVDSELIPVAEHRDEFERRSCRVVLASIATLRVCLDKWALHRRCQAHVRVPDCHLVDREFEPASVELPVVVKPRSGSGSRGVRVVSDHRGLAALPADGTLLAQELLPGQEYSLDVLANSDGQVLAVVPRARLLVDSGIAIAGRTLHDPELEAFGREVAELIGLTGVANVQAKRDRADRPALLEVNPRFPGTMPLTVASGVDMPRLAVDEALGRIALSAPIEFRDVAMVRYLVERFMEPAELELASRPATYPKAA